MSSIFLVDKKDGGNGPVINLKNLNSFVDFQHFKKEGICMTRDLKGVVMASGPKRRLLCCPSLERASKVLKDHLKKHSMGVCMPHIWLASAPRTFSKAMKPVMATLRDL